MTKSIKELGINHKEDEKGNIVISAADALKHAGDIWGKESKEDSDTDHDTPA